jgi:hypothetical protein
LPCRSTFSFIFFFFPRLLIHWFSSLTYINSFPLQHFPHSFLYVLLLFLH